MPLFNINDITQPQIITRYQEMKEKFVESIELETKKYPLSEREQLFAETIMELLSTLDEANRI